MNEELPVPLDLMSGVLKIIYEAEEQIKKLIGIPFKVEVKPVLIKVDTNYLRDVVCGAFDVTLSQLLSKVRDTPVVQARHAYSYFSYVVAKRTYWNIANELNKKHSTIMHSVRTVKDWVKTDYTPFTNKFNIARAVLYNEIKAEA